ncbi:hypothetical protein PanWU01x14_084260, partial [Parasponia andersonii]
ATPHVLTRYPTPHTSTFTPCKPLSISGAWDTRAATCSVAVPATWTIIGYICGATTASSNPATNHSFSRSTRLTTLSQLRSLCMNDKSCRATRALVTHLRASTSWSMWVGLDGLEYPLGLKTRPKSFSDEWWMNSAWGIRWSRKS